MGRFYAGGVHTRKACSIVSVTTTKVWRNRSGLALRRSLALGLAALAIGLGDGCSSTSAGSDGGGGHAGSGAGGAAGMGGRGTAGMGGGAGGPGNAGTDSGVLSCGMSVEQACATVATDTCDLTWSAVQTDITLCGYLHFESECVGYHVLGANSVDVGTGFYYDSTSGALIAIVNNNNAAISCFAGPSGGFTPPSGCSNVTSPPPQCIVDAGNEGGPTD